MVRELRFVHIKRQRLLQAETHNAICFLAIAWESVEIEQDHPHGSIRNNGDHVARPSAYVTQNLSNARGNIVSPPQIVFDEIRYHGARRKVSSGVAFQACAVV